MMHRSHQEKVRNTRIISLDTLFFCIVLSRVYTPVKIVLKYSITKLRQVTGRAVDLLSALGTAATFLYSKCRQEIKI